MPRRWRRKAMNRPASIRSCLSLLIVQVLTQV
jgi:hypothetical protein